MSDNEDAFKLRLQAFDEASGTFHRVRSNFEQMIEGLTSGVERIAQAYGQLGQDSMLGNLSEGMRTFADDAATAAGFVNAITATLERASKYGPRLAVILKGLRGAGLPVAGVTAAGLAIYDAAKRREAWWDRWTEEDGKADPKYLAREAQRQKSQDEEDAFNAWIAARDAAARAADAKASSARQVGSEFAISLQRRLDELGQSTGQQWRQQMQDTLSRSPDVAAEDAARLLGMAQELGDKYDQQQAALEKQAELKKRMLQLDHDALDIISRGLSPAERKARDQLDVLKAYMTGRLTWEQYQRGLDTVEMDHIRRDAKEDKKQAARHGDPLGNNALESRFLTRGGDAQSSHLIRALNEQVSQQKAALQQHLAIRGLLDRLNRQWEKTLPIRGMNV